MWNSIFPDKLRSFDYYLRKLPLFLRQSERFIEHFRIWFDLLEGDSETSGIVPTSDCLMYLLNIFDVNYLNHVNSLDGNYDGTVSDILDKLAALFGVNRVFSVSYIDEENVLHTNEELSLNNKELLTLIKAQIVKNYCNGSTEQIEEFYEHVGLKVYVITTTSNATASLYLAEIQGSGTYSDNVKKMFRAGLLRIPNMGITYVDQTEELTGFLEWDATAATAQGWGRGAWAE